MGESANRLASRALGTYARPTRKPGSGTVAERHAEGALRLPDSAGAQESELTDDGIAVRADVAARWIKDLDESRRAVPEQWTMEYVALRIIEAFEVLRQLPSTRLKPKEYGNGWPAIVRDFKDAVGSESTRAEREEVQKAWERAHHRVPADAISRMEATLSWPVKYLRGSPDHSKALLTWCVCKATPGMSYSKEIKRRGIARPTMERRRRIAIGRIVVGLKTDQMPVD